MLVQKIIWLYKRKSEVGCMLNGCVTWIEELVCHHLIITTGTHFDPYIPQFYCFAILCPFLAFFSLHQVSKIILLSVLRIFCLIHLLLITTVLEHLWISSYFSPKASFNSSLLSIFQARTLFPFHKQLDRIIKESPLSINCDQFIFICLL